MAIGPGASSVAAPNGRNAAAKSAASSTSFISEANTRVASERPEASRSMPSWIIVSSRCVSGLSTGW